MAIKLAVGGLAVVLLAVLLQGCLFGGGDKTLSAVSRSSIIPTATPPVTLPEPILLGQAASSGPGAATPANNSPGTYTVKSGDTLGAIATANNVPPDQQAAWIVEVLRLNAIDDARLLKAGQDLQLPRLPTAVPTRTTPTSGTPSGTQRPGTPSSGATATRPSGTPAASGSGTATPTPRSSTSGGANTYTVASGDTPLAIAIKLGVPSAQQTDWVNQLLSLNNANASGLAIGQVLQLPAIPTSGGNSSSNSSSITTPSPTATKTN